MAQNLHTVVCGAYLIMKVDLTQNELPQLEFSHVHVWTFAQL